MDTLNYSDIENRVRELAKLKPHGWQSEFANKVGISRQYFGQMLKGERGIKTDIIDALLREFGLTLGVHPIIPESNFEEKRKALIKESQDFRDKMRKDWEG